MELPAELLTSIAEMSASPLDVAFPTPRDSPAPGADRARWLRRIVYDNLRLNGFFEFCWTEGDLASRALVEEQADVLKNVSQELKDAGWDVSVQEGESFVAGCVAWPSKVERFRKLIQAMLEEDSDEDEDVIASITQTLDRMRAGS